MREWYIEQADDSIDSKDIFCAFDCSNGKRAYAVVRFNFALAKCKDRLRIIRRQINGLINSFCEQEQVKEVS